MAYSNVQYGVYSGKGNFLPKSDGNTETWITYDSYLQQSNTTTYNYLVFTTKRHKHRDLNGLWQLFTKKVTQLQRPESPMATIWYLPQSDTTTDIWIAFDSYLQQSDITTEFKMTCDSYLQQAPRPQWSESPTTVIYNKATWPQWSELPMTAIRTTKRQPQRSDSESPVTAWFWITCDSYLQ